MSVRKSNNAEFVDVEHKGRVICVRVALNANRKPRAIMGKCSTAGREHYFVWAAGAMLSTKTHLTCRITGWNEGKTQKPPQGTSVRMSDITLDTCFKGLQPPEVVLVVEKALDTYTTQSSPPPTYTFAKPEKTLGKLELPRILAPHSSGSQSPDSQSPCYLDIVQELVSLRERVTYLEGLYIHQGRPVLSAVPTAPTSPSSLGAPSPISMSMPSPTQNHFMLTVLCTSEDA